MNHLPTSLHSFRNLKPLSELSNSLESPASHYNTILQIMSPAHAHVTKAMTLAWKALDHYTTHGHLTSPQKLDMYTSITHKLSCARSQTQDVETTICTSLLLRINSDAQNPAPITSDCLAILRTVKEHLLTALDITQPDHREMESSLAFSWRELCNHLSDSTPLSLEVLDSLTANIHKLVPTYCKLRMLEVEAYQHIFQESGPSNNVSQTPPPQSLPSVNNKPHKVECIHNSHNELLSKPALIASNNNPNTSPPPPSPNNDPFHRFREIKKTLSQIAQIMIPCHEHVERSLIFGWDSLCKFFSTLPPTRLNDLDAYAGIIHKLSISTNHFNSFELKLYDRFFNQNHSKPQEECNESFYPSTPEEKKQLEDEIEKIFGVVPRM